MLRGCVCACVLLAHTLVPVKSRKLQAISVFRKKGKRAPTSQSAAAYETAEWPDLASFQFPDSLPGPPPGMEIPLKP